MPLGDVKGRTQWTGRIKKKGWKMYKRKRHGRKEKTKR